MAHRCVNIGSVPPGFSSRSVRKKILPHLPEGMLYCAERYDTQTGHCNFMAWHTLQDVLKLTGKSRSQLYRDMRSGRVSYRTGKNDRREFETSELIRVYGELIPDATAGRHDQGHQENTSAQQLEAIRQQLADLKQSVTLMLEDKQAREAEQRRQEEEREQLQKEITRLREALEQEKKRGFWSGLFRK